MIVILGSFSFSFNSRYFDSNVLYIYVWIYENGAEEVDGKKQSQSFFPSTTRLSVPFIALLSLLFAHLKGLKRA